MADKPKTAEQIKTPQIGKAESLSQKRRYDTVCAACKPQIEKDVAKRIFERIEKHASLFMGGNWKGYIGVKETQYQRLKKEYEGE